MSRPRRVIIVSHPDFDADGAAGVKATMDMVKQFRDGNAIVLEEVKRRGITPAEYRQFEQWISSLEYFVRTVEL